jgi:hypothetical protein
MANQKERVLAYMAIHGSITSLEAAYMRPRPIMDLPKRISELRRDGYPIVKESEKTSNGARYTRYRLMEKEARA